ncbi:ABC transporter permease [Campylobacter troglodytis]|uniref:ABC transporter permease n=1 Tax=Campylobacter troglodytis TaxID=654363 RepID=UPI001FEB20C9|nr:ABC transporter permease [Campylobacter troglodytis]
MKTPTKPHHNSVTRYLLFKYLRFDKEQPFIMLSMILAFIGVCVGLCVLLVAMAIMNGFDKGLRERFFVMNYPLTVLSRFQNAINDELLNDIKTQFPNLLFSPYLSSQIITRYENKFEGGLLFGVKSEDEKKINKVVQEALKENNLQGFEVLAGRALIEDFNLQRGDKLSIIFSNLNPSGLALTPTTKRFEVNYSFHSGLLLYDKAYIYADIEAVRRVLGRGEGYDGIHIYSDEPFKDIEKIKTWLGEAYSVYGWWEQNENLFSALELEKRALFIVLMLIILASSLNIVSSLLMIVMNRRAEIALLLALGASKGEIKKAFFALGGLIGGSGIVAGLLLAFGVLFLLENFEIITLPADVYGSSKLLLDLNFIDLLFALFGALCIVMLSSYYPARKATQVDVLDTLRNE